MRAPRFGTRAVTEVLPSAASALGVAGFTNPLAIPSTDHVVVVVVDGLGHLQLEQAAAHAPTLQAGMHEPLDAAFPTTTPCGIASIALAIPPGAHGLVGATFELPDFDVVLNPLHWEQDPPPVAVQPEPNMFSRMHGIEVRSHGPAAFATSGMTRTLLGHAEQCGYGAFAPEVIEPASRRLDYVYLPELDKLGHGDGPLTARWTACLEQVDAVIAAILQRIPPTAVLVLTSDHGMVMIPDDRRINADAAILQAGVRRMAGEPRMRQLYTSDVEEVRGRWARELGDRATVLLRDEALDLGLFGVWDPDVVDRIGDVIAIAHDDWALTSATVDPKPSGLRGMHGALTDAELLVPWVVLRGNA